MRLSNFFRQKVLALLLMLVVTPVPGADDAALTNEDILRLVRAGLGTELIIARIRSGPTDFDLSVGQLVALKEAGIADSVIAAMMGEGADALAEAEKPPEDEESVIITYPAPATDPENPADPDSAATRAGAQIAALPSRDEQAEEPAAQAGDGGLPITTLPGFDEWMTCADKQEDSECWMELENQPGCYIWNNSLGINESATWSGGCTNGLADGTGEIVWVSGSDRKNGSSNSGQLQRGKYHGQWVLRYANGDVHEGYYVDGKRHGRWVLRSRYTRTVNTKEYGQEEERREFILVVVEKGSYVDGKRHGWWVLRRQDDYVEEGPYVDHKQHGRWVERHPDGSVHEGPYVNGERHGRWVFQHHGGSVFEGPYVNSLQQGQWVLRSADGTIVKNYDLVGKPGHTQIYYTE